MLQRAASNAYSWWVASHIRTKQSKWLEQSLQDMEEKVSYIVKLISEEGDSFAKKAEMYYKKRPELLNFVEESYRAYRALAERFDHISKELQNANNTLASAFPDQFQFAMEDDDEFGASKPQRRGMANRNPKPDEKTHIPSVPKQFPTKNIKAIIAIASKANNASLAPKKPGQRSVNKAVEALRSGFNKTQAIDEIDKLQKKILTKQTEKEFTKSSYENGVAKYWQIEKEVTEMQEKVSNLQDIFGVGKAIEDNEARTLMLETALKSCQQAFADLQQKQGKAAAEAEEEARKIRSNRDKILAFKGEAPTSQSEPPSAKGAAEACMREESWGRTDVEKANTRKEIEMLRDKMKEHFDGDSSLSVSDMVEKIDELVNKVITLETAVSSQTAMVCRMKEESNELETSVQSLEEDKVAGKSALKDTLKKADIKLKGLQELESRVQQRNNSLETEFVEASGSLDLISQKLPGLNLDEEIEEDSESVQEETTVPIVAEREVGSKDSTKVSEPEKTKKAEDETNWQQLFNEELEKEKALQSEYNSVLQNYEEVRKKLGEIEDKSEGSLTELRELRDANAKKDEEIKCLHEKLSQNDASSALQSVEQVMSKDSLVELKELKDANAKKDEEIQSLQEKLSQNDVASVLPSTEQVKIEDSLVELKELKGANAKKDEDIQSLREKLSQNNAASVLQSAEQLKSEDSSVELKELKDANAKKDEEIQCLREKVLAQNESTSVPECSEQVKSEDSFVELKELKEANAKKDEEIHSLREKLVLLQRRLEDHKNPMEGKEEEDHGYDLMLRLMQMEGPREMSPVEAKLRTDIDEILEENLDFWMRFSSSFSKIQKFHSQVEDLQEELAMINDKKSRKGTSNELGPSSNSEAKAIYKHFKEIQTDLTVWMERSMKLKDELQCRFSQLCRIQEQIKQALNDGAVHDDMQFTSYQAAKFQGEVLNMQQENNRVADDLQASLDNVTILQVDVEKITRKMNEELGIVGPSKQNSSSDMQEDSGNKNQVPLRSFIFGVKPKKQKQSIFSVPPSLQKKYQQLKS